VILAAGLSPAWQHVVVVDGLRPGEVNRARELHSCASGKVINVGLALHHLSGGDSAATLTITPAGGPSYDLIHDDLTRCGVPHRLIRTQSPTRICTTVLDRAAGTATELVENAHPISDDELQEFMTAFVQAARGARAVVLTGSTQPSVPPDIFSSLVKAAPCPAVLDIRGEQLLAALDSRPFLVKPNRQELAQTFGHPIVSDEDLHAAMQELHRRGAECVAVTAGMNPAWLLYEGALYQIQPTPAERIVNPIGCGDCLAAGIAWAVGHGANPLDAVRQGMDLAAQNLTTLLPARF
jgi:1-phosphofructokinase family hexose kinase